MVPLLWVSLDVYFLDLKFKMGEKMYISTALLLLILFFNVPRNSDKKLRIENISKLIRRNENWLVLRGLSL